MYPNRRDACSMDLLNRLTLYMRTVDNECGIEQNHQPVAFTVLFYPLSTDTCIFLTTP